MGKFRDKVCYNLGGITNSGIEKLYHINCGNIGYDNTMDFAPFVSMAFHWIEMEGCLTLIKHKNSFEWIQKHCGYFTEYTHEEFLKALEEDDK